MKHLWKSIVLSSAFVGLALPITAHADQGVMLKNESIENQHGEVREFKKGENIRIFEHESGSYLVEMGHDDYVIPKTSVLKTKMEKEQSLRVASEEANLYLEASLFSDSLQTLTKDMKLERIQDANEESGMIKVKTENGLEGWVYKTSVASDYETSTVTTKAFITEDIWQDNHLFKFRDEIQLADYKDGLYKVIRNNKEYWLKESYISFTQPPLPPTPTVNSVSTNHASSSPQQRSTSTAPKETPVSKPSQSSNSLLGYAYNEIGKPYVYGANGPNAYDCSSFVQTVFRKAGITLPRTTGTQSNVGITVSKSNLQPGDLIFFNTSGSGVSHVGIYVGGGNMIHAGSSTGVTIASINNSYWSPRYMFAKRVM